MLTREIVIAHIKMMNKSEPSYAEKAIKWYCATLPWLELPTYADLKGQQ